MEDQNNSDEKMNEEAGKLKEWQRPVLEKTPVSDTKAGFGVSGSDSGYS